MGIKDKPLALKFFLMLVIVAATNYVYLNYYYSAFLSGPPVPTGNLKFELYGTFSNVTIATNK
ncbi:MAG: hypothetical protein ACP6IS_01865 [Candidatus Asgardarchaeia archaeon]